MTTENKPLSADELNLMVSLCCDKHDWEYFKFSFVDAISDGSLFPYNRMMFKCELTDVVTRVKVNPEYCPVTEDLSDTDRLRDWYSHHTSTLGYVMSKLLS